MEELENKLPTLREVISYIKSKDRSISDALIVKAYTIIMGLKNEAMHK